MKKASIEEMFGAATRPGRLVERCVNMRERPQTLPTPSKLVCCVPETSSSVHREQPDRQTVYISIVVVESLEDGTGTEAVGQRESAFTRHSQPLWGFAG